MMDAETGKEEKIPLLTFASNDGLHRLLQEEAFVKNNAAFFSKVSELIVVYTRDKSELAAQGLYKKTGIEKFFPIQIGSEMSNNAQKIYEEIIGERPELQTCAAYADMNHGTSEMRMVSIILHLDNPKITLLKKEGKMKKSAEGKDIWDPTTVFLRPYLEFYLIRKKRELNLALSFFYQWDFKAAQDVLEKITEVIPEEKIKEKRHISYLIAIAKMFYFWDRFAHCTNSENALRYASEAKKIAESSDESANRKERLGRLSVIMSFLEKFKGNAPLVAESDEMIADRFKNAQIRLEHGLYDDAVARWYSLSEAIAKKELFRAYGIDNSNVVLSEEHQRILSGSLQGKKLFNDLSARKGENRLQLVSSYLLLACLGNPIGRFFFDTAAGKEGWFDANKEFDPKIDLLNKRNLSILAHGKTPVSPEDAKKWEKLCAGLLEKINVCVDRYPSVKDSSRDEILLSPFENKG